MLDAPPSNRSIQLATVVQAYGVNEIAADQQYKGATYAISGTVEKVSKGEGDVPMVTLRTPERSKVYSVRCYFADPTGLDTLRSGGTVYLRGVIDGLRDNSLIIKQCEIVR